MHMKRFFATVAVLSGAILMQPVTLQAQGAASPIKIQFAKGASSKVIKASIRGDQSKLYTINVRAGQKMTVKLVTSNRSSYFNITAPGADQALFIGSSEGNNYSGIVPSSGDYQIDVYLMRNAARRNETANYTLTVGATGR